MEQLWGGLVAVGLGLLLCFVGHRLARVALALWGGAVGFIFGLAAYTFGLALLPTLLQPVPQWVSGVVFAVLFAWLAYAFYAAGLILLLGSLGWGLGIALVTALGWAELQVVFGVIGALVLAGMGLVFDLPRVLMVLVTAIIGASLAVDGLRSLISGQALLDPVVWAGTLNNGWVWLVAQLALIVIGVVAQSRQRGAKTLKASYSG